MDSMVLLHILKTSGYNVSAAHVNFNLRDAESMNDALFVGKWCQDQGIPYHELSKDTKTYAKENNLNTQSAARNIRYEWWEYLMKTHPFDYVATAHHLDDNIETVFLNLFRGTGLKGLRGIPPKRDFYIRPLLEISRSAIASFASAFDIPYRMDESNISDQYQRNRLRHHLIPMLEEMYPGLHSSMNHSLHRINTEWEAWDHAYQKWISSGITTYMDGYLIEHQENQLSFALRWLEEKGIPWMLANDFLTALKADSGQVLQYNNNRLSRTTKGFFLEETQPFIKINLHRPGQYAFGNFTLRIEETDVEEFVPSTDPEIEYINQDVISWPLQLRNIEAGDYFQPLGMAGKSKKLQDLMVDLKLEMFEKERLLLLTNHDHILWVVGLRLDERAKVSPDQKKIYRLQYTRTERS